MANYDRPAFTWAPSAKDMVADSAAGDFQLVSVTQVSWLIYIAGHVNAFVAPTGSSNLQTGTPIAG
jgi:hypothetical protein